MKHLAAIAIAFCQLLSANPLQKAIDAAPPGSKLELPAGVYRGNIVIDKPLILDGLNQKAVIEGEGKGHVITVTSSHVTLQNLTVRNSGESHATIDSAIAVKKSDRVSVLNNRIEDALFGVDFDQVNLSRIEGNFITSKPFDLGLRGDAIRLWYSNQNSLKKNHIYKSRDMVVWYSSGNIIEDNHGEECRYSLHFMYAGKNRVQNNLFERNSVGIFFMYSNGTLAQNNTIRSSIGSFGVGLGMKDSSNFTVRNNTILYNARGIYIDQSPFQPGTLNRYENNRVLFNAVGVQFHATQERSIFEGNTFKGNMEVVINDTPGSKLERNEYHGNFWDDYEGFDRDKDGFGDIPFEHYAYADKIWLYNTALRFFYGSPVMSLLNFLARMAPFSEPDRLAFDPKPLVKAQP